MPKETDKYVKSHHVRHVWVCGYVVVSDTYDHKVRHVCSGEYVIVSDMMIMSVDMCVFVIMWDMYDHTVRRVWFGGYVIVWDNYHHNVRHVCMCRNVRHKWVWDILTCRYVSDMYVIILWDMYVYVIMWDMYDHTVRWFAQKKCAGARTCARTSYGCQLFGYINIWIFRTQRQNKYRALWPKETCYCSAFFEKTGWVGQRL